MCFFFMWYQHTIGYPRVAPSLKNCYPRWAMQIDTIKLCGQVVVLMAPTGSGKSTLVRHITTAFPKLSVTISCTTRTKRPGEEDGREYYFLTREEFRTKVAADEFLEWAEYSGNFYGTLKSEIIPRLTESRIIITEIELKGMLQLKELIPTEHLNVIYIEAGDWTVLKERVLARAPISEEELHARYERYLVEHCAKEYADFIIDNTEIGKEMASAKQQFEAIIATIQEKIIT